MPDEPTPTSDRRELTAQIITAYVRRNQVAADQINPLISSVYRALADLGRPAVEAEGPRSPAVPIRRSVHHDYIVCLECGWRGQMLRRHITSAHGLSVGEYRTRWNLPGDHAITAPGYSERRSAMAKQLGLGRSLTASAETLAIPETQPQPSPKRRGRARTPTASTETA